MQFLKETRDALRLEIFVPDNVGKAERIGRRLRLRVRLRSFDAVCPPVEGNVGTRIVPATPDRASQLDDVPPAH